MERLSGSIVWVRYSTRCCPALWLSIRFQSSRIVSTSYHRVHGRRDSVKTDLKAEEDGLSNREGPSFTCRWLQNIPEKGLRFVSVGVKFPKYVTYNPFLTCNLMIIISLIILWCIAFFFCQSPLHSGELIHRIR